MGLYCVWPQGLDIIQILCHDAGIMILNKERIGILVFLLVVAGGVLVFAGQQNKALLTADISQVVDSINTEDANVQPQPQPQASPVSLAAQKVWVSPTSVPAGEDITVTVDTSDILSFILFVDVFAESANSGQTVKGSIVNIDGEGRKFGTLTIPSGAEQGTWLIKRVSIVGVSGSSTDYYDGQDMTAVFTVTSP